jgi:hypothetical protein
MYVCGVGVSSSGCLSVLDRKVCVRVYVCVTVCVWDSMCERESVCECESSIVCVYWDGIFRGEWVGFVNCFLFFFVFQFLSSWVRRCGSSANFVTTFLSGTSISQLLHLSNWLFCHKKLKTFLVIYSNQKLQKKPISKCEINFFQTFTNNSKERKYLRFSRQRNMGCSSLSLSGATNFDVPTFYILFSNCRI